MFKPRAKRKQQETLNQKAYVKFLNLKGFGFFYRVKNMGTFDPRGFYRKPNETLVAIPDICGYTKTGRAVFIEVKYIVKLEQKKKLIFKAKITDEQKDFLYKAHMAGCIAGVAFDQGDAYDIAIDDFENYPRKPRTYFFMPDSWLEEYVEKYKAQRAKLLKIQLDPLARILNY